MNLKLNDSGFPNSATAPGSTAYYVCRFASENQTDSLGHLFALHKAMSDLYLLSDPGVARIKLQWWQQQCSSTGFDQSAHPLIKNLAKTLTKEARPIAEKFIAAFDAQLHRQGFADSEAFLQRADQIGGQFAALIDSLEQSHLSKDQIRIAGQWIFVIENLQQYALLQQHNIHFLPHGMTDSAASITAFIQDIQKQLPLPVLAKKSALNRYLQLRLALLRVIEREQFDVLQQKISLTPLHKLWIAWRLS